MFAADQYVRRTTIAMVCAICCLSLYAQRPLPSDPPSVLLVHSYHPGFPWTDRLQNELFARLAGEGAEICVEYLDTKRVPLAASEPSYLGLLRTKYSDRAFDVVIVTDDNAYQFVLRQGETLFPGTPIVFCGVNDFAFSQVRDRPLITGVVQSAAVHDTLTVAKKLMPNTERVVFIHDDSPTGWGYRAYFERDIAQFLADYPGMTVEVLSGAELTTDELLTHAANFQSGDLVLMSRWFYGRDGVFVTEEGLVSQISMQSPVPIWGLVGLGAGIVGGRLMTAELQARSAADMARRIINGVPVSELPIKVSGVTEYAFDYEQLNRWGLDISELPQDARIINLPSPIQQRYRRSVLMWCGVVVCQAALIGLLFWLYARRQRIEARLRHSERRMTLVTEGARLGVFDWMAGDVAVRINQPLADLLDLPDRTEHAPNLRRVLRRVVRMDRRLLLRRVQRCLNGTSDSFACECRVRDAEGQRRWLAVQGGQADSGDEGRPWVLGIVRDVTESRMANERRLRLERELQEARKYESIGVLASGLAHDFNNLLQPIIGNASLMAEELPSSSEEYSLLQDICESGRQAADLAQKLLAYSGQAPTVLRQDDAGNLLDRLAPQLRTLVPGDRRLEVSHAAGDIPAYVDAGQFRQVIMNLVTNAVEATRPGGVINISAQAVQCADGQLRNEQAGKKLPGGRYARIAVEDDGEGIAAENLGHVFDPFFTTRFLGRGLGLAAVAGIVHRHGGAMTVSSSPGDGARFEVFFPATKSGETDIGRRVQSRARPGRPYLARPQ